MLIWICALHCEAKPIIANYRLKKSHADRAFDLYLGEHNACIITGIGKIASAAATAWVAARLASSGPPAWINLGIAGAAEHALGTPLRLNQVIDGDSGQSYYPVSVVRSNLTASPCISLSQPSDDYREGFLFDMEASGFFASALRFSSAELVASIKIVSDNRLAQTGKNRPAISDLIGRNLERIVHEASAVQQLHARRSQRELDAQAWEQLLALAHFSQTQQNRLRVLLRYLLKREFSTASLLEKMSGLSSSKAILMSLEQLSRRDSENL